MTQLELLRWVIEVLEAASVPYFFVGSYASGACGDPRLTQDIDVVIDLLPEQVDAVCDRFPSPEFYLNRDTAHSEVRRRGQFNVVHPTSGNKVDFILSRSDDWGKAQLARRQLVRLLPDQPAYTASVEDIILGKLWYYDEGGSEKHIRDIAGILRVQRDGIDRAYIEQWAKQLGLSDTWSFVSSRVARADAEHVANPDAPSP